MSDRRDHKAHMHWHPGLNHSHAHTHGEKNHHGTPWGKPANVIDIPDAQLLRDLRESVRKAEEAKGASTP